MPNSPTFFPDDFPGEITLDHVIPGAAAEFAPLPQDMRPDLAAALAARGIVSLYTHQANAYRQRKDALLQPPGSPAPARAPRAPCALPLPDQGSRPRPAGGAERAQAR